MPRRGARSASITSQESYSAVMITDLVADVPVEADEDNEAKPATNLAYDGQLDGVISNQNLDGNQKTDSTGIAKGVLLNAVQFGQNDSKTKTDEKPIQLSTSLPVPTLSQTIAESKGFKDMSLSRKIAFGFSFIPSVLFVLCFAVILPCNVPKPCVEQRWITRLNYTEATSELEISANIIFIGLSHGESVLFQLNKDNGIQVEEQLSINSTYLKCGKILTKDKTDCIMVDGTGQLHYFNGSYSEVIWKNPLSNEEDQVSNPVILSGCRKEKEEKEETAKSIALAVSNGTIIVMYGGYSNRVSTFTISDCDSVPTRLMPWVVNGSSNIVFLCEKDGEDRLISVPKDVWCDYTNSNEEKPMVLESGVSLRTSVLQPLQDRLVLWSEDEVSVIQPNGTYLWKASNLSHAEENRFILYGNFFGEDKQLALFSSNLISGLKITLLDYSDGRIIKSNSHSDCEATKIIQLKGKKKDTALLLLKKKITKEQPLVSAALTQINDISTKIVNLVSNEEVNPAVQGSASEEIALLEFDVSIDTITVTKPKDGPTDISTITAFPVAEKDTDVLSIFYLSTSGGSQNKTTEVRNIRVANWDKSTKSRCKI